eukprot:724418-Prymnesium_polylepis.1
MVGTTAPASAELSGVPKLAVVVDSALARRNRVQTAGKMRLSAGTVTAVTHASIVKRPPLRQIER